MTTEEIIKGLESVKFECGKHLNEGFAWICKPIDEAIKALRRKKNIKDRQMIFAHLVEKTVSYKPVARELKDMLRIIQCDWGCKVLNVIETKGYGESDQAFIILYEDAPDEEEEVIE